MFKISRFNLVVIDECHYATGNHSYAVIMKKFYHSAPQDQRPKILGLTASPLVNVKESHTDEQLASMLNNLETLLDAKLATIGGLDSELGTGLLTKSAEEKVVTFVGMNVGCDIPPADNLELHETRKREFRQLSHIYKDLGPLVVSEYCKTLIRELSRNEYENESASEFNRAIKHLSDVSNFCEQQRWSDANNVSRSLLM